MQLPHERERPFTATPPAAAKIHAPTPEPRTPTHAQGTAGVDMISLPVWRLPSELSAPSRIAFSIIQQVDGLIFKCLGTRIERDVFPFPNCAVTEIQGCEPYESLGGFLGWYFAAPEFMPAVVAVALSHRGLGAFVVPRVSSGASFRVKDGSTVDWLAMLAAKSVLTFHLPSDAFTPERADLMQVVVAQFGVNGDFKADPREERLFELAVIPELDDKGPHLGVRPYLLQRASPLVGAQTARLDDDVLPAHPDGGFAVQPGLAPPEALPTLFSSPLWTQESEWMASYPDQRVLELAQEAASVGLHGLNAFQGDLHKAVDQLDRELPEAKRQAIRANHIKEVALGQVVGPFPMAIYKIARILPQGAVRKDKYDPESTRWRSTCDPSAVHEGYDDGSINDLTYSPRLLSAHLSAAQLRDTIAQLFARHGHGVVAYAADIPACFRMMRLHPSLLHLFLYRVVTAEHGTEFFADLCCPFGWTAAEWGWQCILGLISWKFLLAGMEWVMSYVDNFYDITHTALVADLPERWGGIDSIFADLGIPLHERNESPDRFKALGWWWDMSRNDRPPQMECDPKKFVFVKNLLLELYKRVEVAVKELESLVGILRWLSSGFQVGKPHLGFLVADLVGHREKHKKRWRQLPIKLSDRAQSAIRFWAKVFPRWSGHSEVFQDFGPTASWQAIGRVDASTDWGCGGWLWVRGEPEAYGFAHQWTLKERARAKCEIRESTSMLEAMGVVMWFHRLGKRVRGLRLLLEGDNENVARGIARAYTPKPKLMNCILAACESIARLSICIRSRAVIGDPLNGVADHLSHNLCERAKELLKEEMGIPLLLM